MARRPERTNHDWQTPAHAQFTWGHVIVEVLMDLRSEVRTVHTELHQLNAFLIQTARIQREREEQVQALAQPVQKPRRKR